MQAGGSVGECGSLNPGFALTGSQQTGFLNALKDSPARYPFGYWWCLCNALCMRYGLTSRDRPTQLNQKALYPKNLGVNARVLLGTSVAM